MFYDSNGEPTIHLYVITLGKFAQLKEITFIGTFGSVLLLMATQKLVYLLNIDVFAKTPHLLHCSITTTIAEQFAV